MNSREMIETAAAEKGIKGVMAIVEYTGVSYNIVSRALRGDNSVKLVHLNDILSPFGKIIKMADK